MSQIVREVPGYTVVETTTDEHEIPGYTITEVGGGGLGPGDQSRFFMAS